MDLNVYIIDFVMVRKVLVPMVRARGVFLQVRVLVSSYRIRETSRCDEDVGHNGAVGGQVFNARITPLVSRSYFALFVSSGNGQ